MSLKRVFKSGLFKVTLTQPSYLERGHTGRFKAEFEHIKYGAIDPSGITFKVYEGSDVKASATPTKDSSGVYYSDYTPGESDPIGFYVIEWSGSYDSSPILVRLGFTVRRSVV